MYELGLGLDLGLEGPGLGLEGPGLVNIPGICAQIVLVPVQCFI